MFSRAVAALAVSLLALSSAWAAEKDSHVYELRIYRTVLGGAQQYGKDFLEVKEAREKYSPIWGAWTGEFPQPNEWIHLWRYKNLEERFKARGAAMKDPDWQAYLAKGPPLLAEMHSTLLMPTNYSPLK